MLTREILPGWLLSLAYATRRALFLRRREFPLVPQGDGWLRLDDAGRGFPHKWVAVIPHLGSDWERLELKGRLKPPRSDVAWEMWLDHADDGPLELELPFGLAELSVRVSPTPRAGRGRRLEIQELGPLTEAAGAARYSLQALARGGEQIGRGFRAVGDASHYGRWLRAFETPSPVASERLRRWALDSGLRFSVVLPPNYRRSTRELERQLPGRVQVCASLAEATADLVVPLPLGVELAPHALAVIACSLARDPEAGILYTDHDRLDRSGQRSHPSFQPGWSPELFTARSAIRGLVAIRRSAIPAGFEAPGDPVRGYALLLACSEQVPTDRIRRIPLVLASLREEETVDPAMETVAVEAHLKRMGVEARVEPGLAEGLRRIRYRLPDSAPQVSIIVPTRNAHQLVEMCVHSVRRLTAYPNYEIVLVDNGSDAPGALASFETLASSGLVRLLRDPRPFNFPALNNEAVRQVSGELICLLNNDVEATHADWLEEMVAVALQPGAGAVGAKLFYPNGTIQHGGVLLGSAADHAYVGVPGDAPGYDQQLLVRREVSAVTAACLLVRRSLYEEVGGMDPVHFPVAFNDVDFCLKLRARGLRNVWTPHARLIHHESATRGTAVTAAQQERAEGEVAALRARWSNELLQDPYLSPNLALDSRIPRLAWPPRSRRPWWS